MDNVEEIFVDLSNVAKDPLLGYSADHAALARWDRLRSVWLRDRGRNSRFTLVADDTLSQALSATDRSRLTALIASGEAVTAPDADTVVLSRAVEAGGSALSNDRYVDHRKLVGLERAKLVGWVVRGEHVRLQDRPLDRLLSVVVSARAQKQAFKDLGITEDAPELAYRWFCRDAACSEDLVAVPRFKQGSAVCPWCDGYLERGSRWNQPIWVKVMRYDQEVVRFVLEDGERVFVGTGQGDDVITVLDGNTADVSTSDVSERHVEVSNDEGRLLVRDNETRGGTSLRRQAPGQPGKFLPPMPIAAIEASVVGPGTKVVLGKSGFTFQIAGSRGL